MPPRTSALPRPGVALFIRLCGIAHRAVPKPLFRTTAFGDAQSIYPLSAERHARIWASFGGIKSEWRDLIAAYPKRFLSALDLGGDRLDQIEGLRPQAPFYF